MIPHEPREFSKKLRYNVLEIERVFIYGLSRWRPRPSCPLARDWDDWSVWDGYGAVNAATPITTIAAHLHRNELFSRHRCSTVSGTIMRQFHHQFDFAPILPT